MYARQLFSWNHKLWNCMSGTIIMEFAKNNLNKLPLSSMVRIDSGLDKWWTLIQFKIQFISFFMEVYSTSGYPLLCETIQTLSSRIGASVKKGSSIRFVPRASLLLLVKTSQLLLCVSDHIHRIAPVVVHFCVTCD